MNFNLLILIIKKKNIKKYNKILKIKKKINKLKIHFYLQINNFFYIYNFFDNYNYNIIYNKYKKNFFLKIPIIQKNYIMNKIISSIKSIFLKNGTYYLSNYIEYYILNTITKKFKYEIFESPLTINYSNLLYSKKLSKFYNNLFKISKKIFLIPTSEVILNSLFLFIKKKYFPIKIVCSSYCFRKEIGNFCKKNSGFKRQQQFKKIEIFQFFEKKKSIEVFYQICSNIIFILKSLKIKFKIIKLCNLDNNNNSFYSFDFEIWDTIDNIWLEISSVSLCINIYNKFSNKKKIFTINASCLPIGRLIYLISIIYRFNNIYLKIPKKINFLITELMKR